MITEGGCDFRRIDDNKRNDDSFNESRNKINNLNQRNRAASHGLTTPLISDDGYFSLANIGGKNNHNLLLPPTNSWPLRRKIGARELKEYGERLDSGSDTYIETKGTGSHSSVNSNSPATALIISEAEPGPAGGTTCTAARNCIDYCTCMLCVKSVYYLCYDGEDDTGTKNYDPCFCSEPSWGCFKRWSCLSILSCFFPCLFCYPVAKTCVTRYEQCKRTRDKAKRKRFKIRFTKNRPQEQTQS